MNNEARQIMELPRTIERIDAELASAMHHLAMLRKMAGDYYILDTRPFWINTETGETGIIGDFNLPDSLQEAPKDAVGRVAVLQAELIRAKR